MADRQKFCVAIMSILLFISVGYLGYYLFLNPNHDLIDWYNHIRLYIFFGQHLITLAMLVRLLSYGEEHDHVVKWMFQLSTVVVMTFIGGQVFVVVRGGRIFGTRMIDYNNVSKNYEAILEFELNQITLYFQIMTDFVMFFIVSSIAMIVLKCRAVDSEERYEFMIDKLKSEDYVEEANVSEKKGCAICLTDLESERVLKLPCEHVFHKECLVNWLKRSTVCPMCRNDIEESLAPNSPQRYPPMNNQPIILPLPDPISHHTAITNPIVHPRPPISLSSRSQISNHQLQRQVSQYQIFDRLVFINQGNQSQKNERVSHSVNFANHENVLSARMRKELMRENQHLQHEFLNLGDERSKNNVLPLSRAITERKTSNQPLNNHIRHPSSPLISRQQMSRTQQILHLKNQQLFQIKKTYPNPNQNLSHIKKQQPQIFHDVSIDSMVRQEIV